MRRPLLLTLLGVLSLTGCAGTTTDSSNTATTKPSTASACIPGARRGKQLCGGVARHYCRMYARPIFEYENNVVAGAHARSRPQAEEIATSLRKRCLSVGVDLGPVASGKP